MRHLERITARPAQVVEDPDERERQIFILRLVIALVAVFKGNSPF